MLTEILVGHMAGYIPVMFQNCPLIVHVMQINDAMISRCNKSSAQKLVNNL